MASQHGRALNLNSLQRFALFKQSISIIIELSPNLTAGHNAKELVPVSWSVRVKGKELIPVSWSVRVKGKELIPVSWSVRVKGKELIPVSWSVRVKGKELVPVSRSVRVTGEPGDRYNELSQGVSPSLGLTGVTWPDLT